MTYQLFLLLNLQYSSNHPSLYSGMLGSWMNHRYKKHDINWWYVVFNRNILVHSTVMVFLHQRTKGTKTISLCVTCFWKLLWFVSFTPSLERFTNCTVWTVILEKLSTNRFKNSDANGNSTETGVNTNCTCGRTRLIESACVQKYVNQLKTPLSPLNHPLLKNV